MMSVKSLVTGGAGFIGSHLVDALLARGDRVVVIDDFSTGKRENLAHVEGKIELIDGDIRDLDLLNGTMKGVDFVFHQAALPSVPRSIENPLESHEVNATGTLNVLLAARDNGVRRVVYASSSSIYGDQEEEKPKVEDMRALPLSPYGLVKWTGEEYCRLFFELYGLPAVSLRYFNVFGPRQDPNSLYSAVIPKFIRAALGGEAGVLAGGRREGGSSGHPQEGSQECAAHIFGDGRQSRDFTYVSNNVSANLLAAEAPVDQVGGKAFNIACGTQTTLLELVAGIEKILGTSMKVVFDPPRAGDILHSRADIARAERALGYRVTVDFEEGLRRTIKAFRSRE